MSFGWLVVFWLLLGQLFWNYCMFLVTEAEDDDFPFRDAIVALVACWVVGPLMWWFTYNKAAHGNYSGFKGWRPFR